MSSRPDYEASVAILKRRGILDEDESPAQPAAMPQPDDGEALGLHFFRTAFDPGTDLSGLCIPRTFFGRSEIKQVSFRASDLSESNLRWNDFSDVDFSEACLAGADLRASVFERVNFDHADLRGADLRRSEFKACSFRAANLAGVLLSRSQRKQLALAPDQRAQVAWQWSSGPEPSGG